MIYEWMNNWLSNLRLSYLCFLRCFSRLFFNFLLFYSRYFYHGRRNVSQRPLGFQLGTSQLWFSSPIHPFPTFHLLFYPQIFHYHTPHNWTYDFRLISYPQLEGTDRSCYPVVALRNCRKLSSTKGQNKNGFHGRRFRVDVIISCYGSPTYEQSSLDGS